MKTIMSILALSLSVPALASTEVGNGGDVILCETPQGKTAQLLDFYEAVGLYGLPNVLNPAASVEDNLKTLIANFAKIEPERAQKYQTWAKTFLSETVLRPNAQLVDIDDSKHLEFPQNCKVEQIAIQKEVRYPLDRRYVISQDLWNLLDNANRAGLIFHELLYRDAIEHKGLPNGSRVLRMVNALAAADQFELLGLHDRTKIWQEFGFKNIRNGGILIKIDAELRWKEHEGKTYLLAFRSETQNTLQLPNGSVEIRPNGYVSLYPSGAIYSVGCTYREGDPENQSPSRCAIDWNGQKLQFSSYVAFHENGNIKSITTPEIKVNSKRHGAVVCREWFDYYSTKYHGVNLHEDGSVMSCATEIEERRFTSERYDLNVKAKEPVILGFDKDGVLNRLRAGNKTTVSGTIMIQGKPREIESLTLNPDFNKNKIAATLKHPEQFRVGKRTVAFRAGKIFIQNDNVIAGTLADVTVLDAPEGFVNQKGTPDIRVAPYAGCWPFNSPSDPVPTVFDVDGTVAIGAMAETTMLTNAKAGLGSRIHKGEIMNLKDGFDRLWTTQTKWTRAIDGFIDPIVETKDFCDL